jgi:hypothetical protein
MKNKAKTVILALETEVADLLDKGWKVLDEAEEVAHRALLHEKPELTSADAQETARVDAGVYKVVDTAPATPQAAPADAADTAPAAPAKK